MSRRHIERKKNREGADSGAVSVLKNALKGVLFAIPIMLLLTLIAAYIAYTREDPNSAVGVFSFTILYISALLAGLFASKGGKESPLLSAALSGVMLAFILLIVSFFFGEEYSAGYGWGIGLLIRSSLVAVSALGGFIGIHKVNSKRRKRRRS